MGTLVREAKLVEKLVNAPNPQVDPPLLLNQALCPLACPLVTVQAIIGRCLVQQDVVQDLALPERQSLRDGPPLRGQKGIETAMKEKIERRGSICQVSG